MNSQDVQEDASDRAEWDRWFEQCFHLSETQAHLAEQKKATEDFLSRSAAEREKADQDYQNAPIADYTPDVTAAPETQAYLAEQKKATEDFLNEQKKATDEYLKNQRKVGDDYLSSSAAEREKADRDYYLAQIEANAQAMKVTLAAADDNVVSTFADEKLAAEYQEAKEQFETAKGEYESGKKNSEDVASPEQTLSAQAAMKLAAERLNEAVAQKAMDYYLAQIEANAKAMKDTLAAADNVDSAFRDEKLRAEYKGAKEQFETAKGEYESGKKNSEAVASLEQTLSAQATMKLAAERLNAAVAQQAMLACNDWKEKNSGALGKALEWKDLPKGVVPAHAAMVESHKLFEEALSKGDFTRAALECRDLERNMRVFEARKDFKEIDQPAGKGIWKFDSVKVYKPSGPMEIPGTSFSDVCPGQDHVNRQIVEAKLAGKIAGAPVIPVVITLDGKIVLMDKHHAFVACMALGRSVKLALSAGKTSNPKGSWQECSWKGFEKPAEGVAQPGFVLSGDESTALEGKAEEVPNWKEIVPWRQGTPETDVGKAKSLMENFEALGGREEDVTQELINACDDDKGLAAKLYEVVKMGAVKVKVRPKPKGSTGGDWDPEENAIFVDDDLNPLDMVDMVVWEAHNAIHQVDYSKVRHEGHAERMDQATVGEKMAKIEAKTEVEYVEHLLARQANGTEVSENGRKHIDEIDKKFLENNLPAYSQMDKEQRQSSQELVEQIFLSTPHDAKEQLPNRNALNSGELYAYEYVADTQNVKGIVAYFKDEKVIPEGRTHKKAFLLALANVKDSPPHKPGKPKLSWSGKFYDIVSREAIKIFGLKLAGFTGAQSAVADDEYTQLKQSWAGALEQRLAEVAKAAAESPEEPAEAQEVPKKKTAKAQEVPEEGPVRSLTPAQQEFEENFQRVEEAGLQDALGDAYDVLAADATEDGSHADSIYEKANLVLVNALKRMELNKANQKDKV